MNNKAKWVVSFGIIIEWLQALSNPRYKQIHFVNFNVKHEEDFGIYSVDLIFLGLGLKLSLSYPHPETKLEKKLRFRIAKEQGVDPNDVYGLSSYREESE